MNMPPPPPHVFHGYAGSWAQTADVAGSSSGYQPSWDQYIPQPDVGASSRQSVGSSEWQQHGMMDWGYGSSSSGGTPPLFAARRPYSARSYHDLTQGIENLNVCCGNLEQATQDIQTTLNTHIDNTMQQHERQDTQLVTLINMVQKEQEDRLAYIMSLGYIPKPALVIQLR